MKVIFVTLLIIVLCILLYMFFNMLAFIVFLKISRPPDLCDELWEYLTFGDYFDIMGNNNSILLICFMFPWFIYRYVVASYKQNRMNIVEEFIEELTE